MNQVNNFIVMRSMNKIFHTFHINLIRVPSICDALSNSGTLMLSRNGRKKLEKIAEDKKITNHLKFGI